MSWIAVFSLFGLFLPSNSVLHNKTYDTLEFISSGDETRVSLSSARTWCQQHGSTLAEITSEHIWNLYLKFVEESGLNRNNLLLNANGKELPAWQWITGETFSGVDSYRSTLKFDGEMYGRLSKIRDKNLSVEKSSPSCHQGCDNGYICEHPGNRGCKVTQHSYSIPLDGSCYVFHHDTRVNWFGAYYECKKNNGRLATFKNIKDDETSIAQQLQRGMEYWIGLYRYEWRWADSKELLGFSNWETSFPNHAQSCIFVSVYTNKWHTTECNSSHTFVCLRNVTKCDTNPCLNNATCSFVDNNYTCQCAPGFTGSHCETKRVIECDLNSEKAYICLCAPAWLECQTGSSNIVEPPVPGMSHTDTIVVVVIAVVILLILILLIILCVRRNNKIRKPNAVEVSRRYETTNTPEPAIYSEINISDKNGNIDKNVSHPSGNAIYGQVVQSSNDDHKEDATTSSSMVYAELEFVQQDKKAQTPSG